MIHSVYIISRKNNKRPCKVGVTCNIQNRMSALQCGSFSKLELFVEISFSKRSSAFELEAYLLGMFAHKRLMGEWLNVSANEVRDCAYDWIDDVLLVRFREATAERVDDNGQN